MTSRPGVMRRGLILPGWLLRWEALLVLLLLLASVVNASLSPYFLDVHNLFGMTFNFMERGLIALTMTFIIISGNIDLSVASNLAMSAILMGVVYQAGWNIWLAALIGLAVGTLGGMLNGLLIAKVRLPALVVTLGTYALYRGIAFVVLGDQAVTKFPSEFTYLGQGYIPGTPVPVPLVLFAVFAVLYGLLLHRTTFGRFVYAIGSNEEACRYSGVNVDQVKIALFALSGLMSALAGMVLAARFGSVRPNIATGFELEVITTVVLGGVDIFGGRGTMPGVVLALFLIGVARYGMSLKNVPGQTQTTLIGVLLIAAILLPQVLRRLTASGVGRKTG
ncbi:MAG: ABC transporter permease [Anaerolineae bacterium]|nr:ABC transporter permease [Anaerolineae bacterium]MDW8098691.1 ABC transporter permease [Anaerolineae bacterium]